MVTIAAVITIIVIVTIIVIEALEIPAEIIEIVMVVPCHTIMICNPHHPKGDGGLDSSPEAKPKV